MFGKIINSLFKRNNPIPLQLYGAVVAQSRNPEFYTDFKFEDSVMGRFDLLTLHMFLLSRRLVREDDAKSLSLNQEVFDIYTNDTDSALREIGIGDQTVPKRKKKMIRGFYGQVEDFANLLDDGNSTQLGKAVKTRFFEGKEPKKVSAKTIKSLAKYISECGPFLDEQSSDDLYAGKLSWPDISNYV